MQVFYLIALYLTGSRRGLINETGNDYQIHSNFDYDRVKALSSEAREKLKKMRPATIGQMSRISGVSPSDVSIMTVYLGK